jgi:hypothetical protein
MSPTDKQRAELLQTVLEYQRRESLFDPVETREVPAPVREGLKAFGEWLASEMDGPPLQIRWFKAREIDRHTGFWSKLDPSSAWLAAERPGTEMARTYAHEYKHSLGELDEATCTRFAAEMVAKYERECPVSTPTLIEPRQYPQFLGSF